MGESENGFRPPESPVANLVLNAAMMERAEHPEWVTVEKLMDVKAAGAQIGATASIVSSYWRLIFMTVSSGATLLTLAIYVNAWIA